MAPTRQATVRLFRGALAFGVMLSLCLACGCGVRAIRGLRRTQVPPDALWKVTQSGTVLKAHLHDGSVLVFDSWVLNESTHQVSGRGQRFDSDRQPVGVPELAVSVDSVALFESDAVNVPASIVPITMMTGLHIAMSALCLSNPKACFGSCPTFYAWDGERQVLVAEGFSASVAPALEATDLDALDRVQLSGRRFTLIMTNEALETHVVRRADLLLAPRADGERVVADAAGALWATRDWLAPGMARGDEGNCSEALAARDMRERTSPADSTDLGARETLDLSFDAAPAGERGLVIVGRQSLLSTYLFYQTLAWMGRSAGTWLASLERIDSGMRSDMEGPGRLLGAIEVQVRTNGEWVTTGEFHETGPLAWDSRLVPLPEGDVGPLQVRLRLTRGMWRLDRVALVSVAGPREPLRIRPARVLRRGQADTAALASLLGEAQPLTTQPGDTLAIEYALPASARAPEVFLESRGYYLEWMRDAWVAEENPGRLAELFLDPRGSLRKMAPEFKRLEPEMEHSFWGSRYAR